MVQLSRCLKQTVDRSLLTYLHLLDQLVPQGLQDQPELAALPDQMDPQGQQVPQVELDPQDQLVEQVPEDQQDLLDQQDPRVEQDLQDLQVQQAGQDLQDHQDLQAAAVLL